MKIESTGIRKQLPKIKSFLKNYFLGLQNWEGEEFARLKRYSHGESFSYSHTSDFVFDYNFSSATGDLTRMSLVKYWHSIHGALKEEGDWQMYWEQAVAYGCWSDLMDIKWHFHALDEFNKGKRQQKLKVLMLKRIGMHIGNCLSLGWSDLCIDLARWTYKALAAELFNDGGDYSHRRTQYFVLRLVMDWQNIPFDLDVKSAYDEPIFNALIENWREPDAEKLVPVLLAACDRHTQQARVDSNRESYDLNQPEHDYNPFEILSVFRLRDLNGLANPVLDHPLMKTPLAQLLPVSTPYMDELLAGILRHARQEFPDL